MIISQSFKTKNPDGSFGNEVALSTISDLVFYEAEDNKTLTQKTSEIEADIAKERQDRIDADKGLKKKIEDDINEEAKRADNAIAALKNELQPLITTNTSNISKNANNISTNTSNISANTADITTLQNKYNSETKMSEVESSIATNTANITALENKYNSETKMNEVDLSISRLQASVASLNEIVGSITDPIEQTILEKLADIEARLVALEKAQQTI